MWLTFEQLSPRPCESGERKSARASWDMVVLSRWQRSVAVWMRFICHSPRLIKCEVSCCPWCRAGHSGGHGFLCFPAQIMEPSIPTRSPSIEPRIVTDGRPTSRQRPPTPQKKSRGKTDWEWKRSERTAFNQIRFEVCVSFWRKY